MQWHTAHYWRAEVKYFRSDFFSARAKHSCEELPARRFNCCSATRTVLAKCICTSVIGQLAWPMQSSFSLLLAGRPQVHSLGFLFFFLYWVIFQSRIQEGNPKRPSFAPGNGGYPRVNASRSHTGGWCSERRPNQGRAMGTESIASELQGLR